MYKRFSLKKLIRNFKTSTLKRTAAPLNHFNGLLASDNRGKVLLKHSIKSIAPADENQTLAMRSLLNTFAVKNGITIRALEQFGNSVEMHGEYHLGKYPLIAKSVNTIIFVIEILIEGEKVIFSMYDFNILKNEEIYPIENFLGAADDGITLSVVIINLWNHLRAIPNFL